MSDRIDHAAEALSLIDGKNQPPSTHDGDNPEADRMIAEAQVHATLALVEHLRAANEQQRIANLIAFHDVSQSQSDRGHARSAEGDRRIARAAVEIREGLGL